MKQTFYQGDRPIQTRSVALPPELGPLENMVQKEFLSWISAEPFQESGVGHSSVEGSMVLPTELSGGRRFSAQKGEEVSIAPIEIIPALYGDLYTGVSGNVYLIRNGTDQSSASGWITSDQIDFKWIEVKEFQLSGSLPPWKRKTLLRSVFLGALPIPTWIVEFLEISTRELIHRGTASFKLMQNLNWISQWQILEDTPLKLIDPDPELVYYPLTGQTFPKDELVEGLGELRLHPPGCSFDFGYLKMRACELKRHDGKTISIFFPLGDQP